MTKNEKLKQIREAVDLALEAQGLESTRALVAGCKVLITEADNGKVYLEKDCYRPIPFEAIFVGRYFSGCSDPECCGDMGTDYALVGKEVFILEKDVGDVQKFETIVRDINWEDCSLAIENPEISFRYFFGKPLKIQIEKGGHLMCTWKPKVPLHLQDSPTIDFIYDLIVNNK